MPRGRPHYRLKYSEAIDAHDVALKTGGVPGILNENSIRSAIARPFSGYYRPISLKAAALVESVCRNHGFADGNKRTCLLLLNLLLDKSGYRLVAYEGEDLELTQEDLLVDVANGALTLRAIENWMKIRIREKPRKRTP